MFNTTSSKLQSDFYFCFTVGKLPAAHCGSSLFWVLQHPPACSFLFLPRSGSSQPSHPEQPVGSARGPVCGVAWPNRPPAPRGTAADPPPSPCHCRESVPPGRHTACPWLFRAAAMLGPDPWGSLEAPRQRGELPVCPPATSPGCHVRVLHWEHPQFGVTPHTRVSLALVPIRRGAVTAQQGWGLPPASVSPGHRTGRSRLCL